MKLIKKLEVYTKDTLGYPLPLGNWIGEPEYIPVTRVRMFSGTGFGGNNWYEYVHLIPDERILTDGMITVQRVMGEKNITLNTRYMLCAENFDLMHRQFQSQGDKGDILDMFLLVESGHRIEFLDKFGMDVFEVQVNDDDL